MSSISKDQTTFGATLVASILHDMDDGCKAAMVYTYHIEFEGSPTELVKAIAELPMVECAYRMTLAEALGKK